MEINRELTRQFDRKISKSPMNRLAMNAVGRVELQELAINREIIMSTDFSFSHEVEGFDEATAQQKVGICWMFAALNMLRIHTLKKTGIKNFEFSGTYLMFWDKLEKANYFLGKIIEFIDRPSSDRALKMKLDDPIPDGGDWYMFANLVNKYGLVPSSMMKLAQYSMESSKHNEILALKLRQCAATLREMRVHGASVEDLEKKRTSFIEDIYRILAICFGTPPEKFNWSYRDDKKKFHREHGITPLEFFHKYVSLDLNQQVCLWSCPLEDTPYGKTYTIENSRNMVNGKPFKALNLPLETLKNLAVKMIRDGKACIFSCDVGKESLRKEGLMYRNLYNYDLIFQSDFSLDRKSRLQTGEAHLTHSMLLVGVDIHRNKPLKWKVENSWGTDVGKKGFFIMSDEWFDEHVYQIIIPSTMLDDEIIQGWQQEPVVLPMWHPMF